MILLVAFFFLFFVGMESLALARAGGGTSSGSRGFSSGGGYRSAPSGSSGYQSSPQTAPPSSALGQPSTGRSFMSGMAGGMVGGMLGSMLFRGHGYAGGGGWGGGGIGFGDILLVFIILAAIYFIWKRFRMRREAMEYGSTGAAFGTTYGSTGYNAPQSAPDYGAPTQGDVIATGLRRISDMDPTFDEFRFKEIVEDNFFKIQSAWGKRDLSGVRNLFTPQMLNTFQEDVKKYIADKQINRLENIAVRQVEIVDAVQDQGVEYITVKFLASLLDYVVSDTNNELISGSSTDPVKFLEYWNWTRRVGERTWLLAGITQEGDY